MFICMYLYFYMYKCINIYILVCLFMYIYIYMCIYVYTHGMYMYEQMCFSMYIYICIYMHTYIYIILYIYIIVYICVRMNCVWPMHPNRTAEVSLIDDLWIAFAWTVCVISTICRQAWIHHQKWVKAEDERPWAEQDNMRNMDASSKFWYFKI